MRAIVLSAGQGRRLRPLTAEIPKCLLAIDGERSALELQLRALARCGIEEATVAVGFAADRVDRFLESTPIPGLRVETLYNPFYATSDNLATCWICRSAMTSDFVLLNGDTLFEDRVLRRLLDGPDAPVTVTIDHKSNYDDDDMKVSLYPGGRLRAIGKKLLRSTVGGESIGLLAFRGAGVAAFSKALDATIRQPTSLGAWYLSVVNEMAQRMTVQTVSIEGLWWREIDSPEDLADARISFPRRQPDAAARGGVATA